MKKLCDERPNKWFLLKWALKFTYFGILIGLIKNYKANTTLIDPTKLDGEVDLYVSFDDLLIVYCL